MPTINRLQLETIRQQGEALRTAIDDLLEQHTGKGKYDPENAAVIDCLNDAMRSASDSRLHLLDAVRLLRTV